MKKLLSIALCICLTLAAVFTAVPSFATKASADTEAAQALLSAYYNGGEYIKRTEIYAAGLGVGDVNNFHAKASASNRKTVYSDGNTKLVMTTDPNSLVGTGYKDDTEKGHVVRFTTDENGNEAFSFDVPQYKTIKDWFTDLEEMATLGTWNANQNGSYEQVFGDDVELATKWVHFIAPMWDAPETVYRFERVTMKNSIEGLTLTLHGRIGEAEESEFAKAKITLPKGWYLVTDASTLKADDQIVIVAKNADYALSTNQKSSNRGATTITKSGNTVTFGDDVQIITLEAGTVDGTFAFNTGSGYLYAASSSGNQLKTQTNNNANGSWAITITDGVASIVAKESSNRNVMQYNPNNGSPLFACYASASQEALAIYRFIDREGIICDHANTTTTTVDATCAVPGSTNVTCTDCGETISTETIPATDNHTYVDGKCSVCGANDPDFVNPDAPAEPTWQLVTDINMLAADAQIVIVAKNADYALSTTQNSNNRSQAAVTKVGDTVTFDSDVQIITLEAGTTAGTFAFNTGSGYLYAASSSKNYLRTETTLSANSSWTIEIAADGTATIKANGSNTRNWLRYNSTNNPPIFSCYSSGQADVVIYVKVVG